MDLRIAARRGLADRREFVLDDEQREAWEQINRQPARTLPGLRELMARPRPSPSDPRLPAAQAP